MDHSCQSLQMCLWIGVSNVVFCFNVYKGKNAWVSRQSFDDVLHDLLAFDRNSLWTWIKKHNFGVLCEKNTSVKFVLFPSTGHVNCVGNRGFGVEIDDAIRRFNHFVGNDRLTRETCKVVNSTVTSHLGVSSLDIRTLIEAVRKSHRWSCCVCPGIFPAAVLRHNTYPTALLFTNGTVNVLGAKTFAMAKGSITAIQLNILSKTGAY